MGEVGLSAALALEWETEGKTYVEIAKKKGRQ